MKLLRRIGNAVTVARIADFLWAVWTGKVLWLTGAISVVATVIAAIQNGFDWGNLDKYVLAAALIYVVLTGGWLISVLLYRKLTAKYNLVVSGFEFMLTPFPQTSGPPTANKFQCSVILQNIGDLPLNYRIEDIDFRINNTVCGDVYANRGGQIDPKQMSRFSSATVDLHQPIAMPVDGKAKIQIAYGWKGKEKFIRNISIKVRFFLDPAWSTIPVVVGGYTGIKYEWTYVDEE